MQTSRFRFCGGGLISKKLRRLWCELHLGHSPAPKYVLSFSTFPHCWPAQAKRQGLSLGSNLCPQRTHFIMQMVHILSCGLLGFWRVGGLLLRKSDYTAMSQLWAISEVATSKGTPLIFHIHATSVCHFLYRESITVIGDPSVVTNQRMCRPPAT